MAQVILEPLRTLSAFWRKTESHQILNCLAILKGFSLAIKILVKICYGVNHYWCLHLSQKNTQHLLININFFNRLCIYRQFDEGITKIMIIKVSINQIYYLSKCVKNLNYKMHSFLYFHLTIQGINHLDLSHMIKT